MGMVQTPGSVDCDNPAVTEDEFNNSECDETCPYYEEGESDEDEQMSENEKAIEEFIEMCETATEIPGNTVVSIRHETYHDVTVYADGHEERYYIGD
jgi:hypothetical protein